MVVPRLNIEFVPVAQPITALVTKFGGQPVWRDGPAWPLSWSTGQPMRFICQIALTPEPDGPPDAMAYLFMTDPDPDAEVPYVDGTWDPESGENAVVLQPGDPPPVATAPQATGPTLYSLVPTPDGSHRQPQPGEFLVTLEPAEDMDFTTFEATVDAADDDDPATDELYQSLTGNKLGGTPSFIQFPEFPLGEDAPLLLQLDAGGLPFEINFGDVGTGYLFLAPDRRQARFLWQCT
jgi:hypothetical protein